MDGNVFNSATLIDNTYRSTNTMNYDNFVNGILQSHAMIGIEHKVVFTIHPNTDIPKSPEYRIQRDFNNKNKIKHLNKKLT